MSEFKRWIEQAVLESEKKKPKRTESDINFVSLLALIVDIQFKHKHNKSLDWDGGRGYRKDAV